MLYRYIENHNTFYEKSKEVFNKLFENFNEELRKKIGVKLSTGTFVNELHVYKLINEYFTPYKVIHQGSPSWLSPQKFDVYIPQLNLAIEYQGEQHFFPLKIYGGENGFVKNIERDKRKKDLATANSVIIEYINYTDDIIKRVEEIASKYLPNSVQEV